MAAAEPGKFGGLRRLAIWIAAPLIFLACIILLSAIARYVRRIEVTDPGRPASFRIKESWMHADYLRIHVVGALDGNATIQAKWPDGRPEGAAVELGPGPVDRTFERMIYESHCILEYQPRRVNSGHLAIYFDWDGY